VGLEIHFSEYDMKEFKNFINGEYVANASGKTYENRNPVDNSLIGLVYEAGKPEVDAAVAAAKAALHGPWGKLSVVERCAMLDAIVAEINHRFDDFLQAEIADTGKPAHLASHIDIPRGAANFKIFTDTIKNVSTESFEMRTPDGKTARSYGVRTPRGVIAVISPWNLPLLLMTWKVGPALACGNTVVVKPSEVTPATATLLGEVMNKVGVPPGVYNVINGFGVDSAGALLTAHPDVSGITFTGETKTGTAIMKAGADGIRPVSLELGGKNAAVVFADCDFENAVNTITRSVFENCGQVCLGTERVYVERPIFDKFVNALKAKAEGMKPGRPFDEDTKIGPLVSKVHQKKVLSYYQKAREEGATIVTGGGVPDMPTISRTAAGSNPPSGPACPKPPRWCARRSSGRAATSSPSTPKKKPCAWPMTPSTAWPPPSTPRTSAAPAAWPPRSRWACAGSTAGSCAICARPSAAPSSRASAARAGCIRWSSTPSCAT
jgi:aminomuconate-semialdehyde/2-hydroxymuconate-6-semialdehyde dehydrogenase